MNKVVVVCVLFGMLTFAKPQYLGYPGYPQYQQRPIQYQPGPLQYQQNQFPSQYYSPYDRTYNPQVPPSRLYYNPQFAPGKSSRQPEQLNNRQPNLAQNTQQMKNNQNAQFSTQQNQFPANLVQRQQAPNTNSNQAQPSPPPSKSRPPRLPYRPEAPQFPRQPNQQGSSNGEFIHPSFSDLASMKAEDHPNGTITKAVVNMRDIVPTPQLKYDEDENPAISFGNDGFVKEIGDRAVKPGEYPFNVQVRRDGYFTCGAALVKSPVTGRHIIITAAHCITFKRTTTLRDPATYEVRMGILGVDDEGQMRKVKAFLVHPDYAVCVRLRRPIFHDIGLIIPDRDFDESELVQPIDLPSISGPTLLDKIVVMGWGRGREAGNPGSPKTLRSVDLPVWDNSDCKNVYLNESGHVLITEEHFCAGAGEGGLDTCQGDSGAPAIAWNRGKIYLAGLGGWGKGCGRRGFPGVYPRVWSYVDWIVKTLYDYEKFGKLPPPTRKENAMY